MDHHQMCRSTSLTKLPRRFAPAVCHWSEVSWSLLYNRRRSLWSIGKFNRSHPHGWAMLSSYQISLEGQRILNRCSLIHQLRPKCQVSSAVSVHLRWKPRPSNLNSCRLAEGDGTMAVTTLFESSSTISKVIWDEDNCVVSPLPGFR